MWKLLKLFKPYKTSLLCVIALVFVQTLAEVFLPTLMSDIVDRGIARNDIPYIWRMGGIMLLTAAGGTFCSIIVSLLAARNSTGFARLLRELVFSKVESFSLHEFDTLGTATLITRTTNDINQIQVLIFMIQRLMISAPIMCIGGIIMAIGQDKTLAWVYAVSVPILVILIGTVMVKAIPLFRQMQQKLDRLNLVMRENLTGIRVIRAFNRLSREAERFTEASRDLMDNAIRINKLVASLMPGMILVMNFTIISIVWFGGLRIEAGHMQVGSLMAFIQYSVLIMISLMIFSMIFIMVPRAAAAADRIGEVLEVRTEIEDQGGLQLPGKEPGRLEFRRVGFTFPGAESAALMNISFTARPGEITAIIGGTGAGKSTLANLILRFYDVNEGAILLEGLDVRELPLESLRARIGYVPQSSILFSGSIADNIRYGLSGADEELIGKAAEIAQARDFIDALPDGFDSIVEQGGRNFSGGQKQRLAIARALIRQPDIYIFDDSFSALDFRTDARLRKALRSEVSSATVIIIAQRISTVMDADQIIVLDEGKMVARGRHQELMTGCAVYREIVSSQLSEEELA